MKVTSVKWALSAEISGKRCLLGLGALGWCTIKAAEGVALFDTREDARLRKTYCVHVKTRVEKVQVTVETI